MSEKGCHFEPFPQSQIASQFTPKSNCLRFVDFQLLQFPYNIAVSTFDD